MNLEISSIFFALLRSAIHSYEFGRLCKTLENAQIPCILKGADAESDLLLIFRFWIILT